MPNPLGRKEIGFFPGKGGAKGQGGSAKGPAVSEALPGKAIGMANPKNGQKKGDPEVKRLLQTLIGVKKSKEKAAGKPLSQKQKGT